MGCERRLFLGWGIDSTLDQHQLPSLSCEGTHHGEYSATVTIRHISTPSCGVQDVRLNDEAHLSLWVGRWIREQDTPV